jgi:hypothetical protein
MKGGWPCGRPPFVVSPSAHQFQVPEATHHAGTANVTAAMTAITVAATQRLASTLLMVTRHLLCSLCLPLTVPET